MWDEATKELVANDQLVVIGVVQEQHAERAKLYKQWRQFEWPIVQDALNLLQVKVVPIPVAIDEEGRVASHRATAEFLKGWIGDADVATIGEPASALADADLDPARNEFLWNGQTGVAAAITAYDELLADTHSDDPAAHFEAAVAYRTRYDANDNPADFQKAIDLWAMALDLDPNQYIYRRRIQQYGARLGKPYPFYDWVEQAQAEIRDRGETPVQLTASLTGAEIARPVRKLEADDSVPATPDPDDEILEDTVGLVDLQVVTVPQKVRPGEGVRVYVLLEPGDNAKWNNEADPTRLWINAIDQGVLSNQLVEGILPEEIESSEIRQFEFEMRPPMESLDPVTMKGYALYYVCIKDTGQCVYRRQPFQVDITVDGEADR
ncbi:MAG: hypothetical protein ACR2NP_17705 [Pirellulaceae bacterium]